ncbi:choline dehydrogenase BetA [Janthinobacterium sp. HH01]|uniref:GMC family oxidoreductase n=1 Tax=Janthinobacterium sp. HH01 TaxID=1198452 RepID=UPI0002AE9B5D|nr:GMC family oxidoreductase N-terminal domain-containing protein [Janthinobacterium sp. HH01]ELX12089.1 choline dehydrogenase BetA [Janthinobacterium sp. HH01]
MTSLSSLKFLNDTVDILVVGGGSAGAVLASRLSERADRSVLLLEAGPAHAAWDYPAVISSSDRLGGDQDHEWGYKTEPGYIGHPVGALRGKVLGGSSGINGAVAIRARASDFQNWNLPGWSYDDLLPSFKRLEDSDGGATDLHGQGGPLPVRQLTRADTTPMQQAFTDAALAAGYTAVSDFDGADPHGVGPYRMNVVNGVRVNTGMAYLGNSVRARANLRVQGGVTVDRVLFDGTQAVGVRLADGQVIKAKQVVLSAGTYGSAAILLRSGVGPAKELEALDIPSVADLPVGQRLKDHPFYYNAYAAKPEAIGAQSPAIGAKLWTRSSLAKPGELDLHITATHLFPHEFSPTKVGFVLAVALTLPRSVGKFRITTRDPLAAPSIDLNFLADAGDRARLLEGVKLARKLGQTAPLSALVHSELAPGADAQDDNAIERSVLDTLDTYHHPTSTVPMGRDGDPHAVLDLECRVRGVTGLRVVDASIFPDTVSVATNITTIAIAEHAAARFF